MRDLGFKESMSVEHLGEIEIKTMSYSARRRTFAGISDEDEQSEAYQTQFMLLLLAETVTYADTGEPCGSVEEWDMFAGRHTGIAMDIFKKASDLNGFQAEVIEKN